MELIDYGRESPDVNYAHMIQSFNRFLIDHFVAEWSAFPRNPRLVKSLDIRTPALAPATQLLGINAKTIVTCTTCQTARAKDNLTHVLDLVYPRTVRILRFGRVTVGR